MKIEKDKIIRETEDFIFLEACGDFKIGDKVYIHEKTTKRNEDFFEEVEFGYGVISGFEWNKLSNDYTIAVTLDNLELSPFPKEIYGDPHFYPRSLKKIENEN